MTDDPRNPVPVSGLGLTELRRAWACHAPDGEWFCTYCEEDWPCQKILLLEIIERLGHR